MPPRGPQVNRFQAWFFRLNRRQTRAFLIGVITFFATILVPPWEHVFANEFGKQSTRWAGFEFITNPPLQRGDYTYRDTRIQWQLILVEWLGVVIGTAALVRSLRDRNDEGHTGYGGYR